MRSHFLKCERLIVKSSVIQGEVQFLKQILEPPPSPLQTLVENNLAIDAVDKRIEKKTNRQEKGKIETRSNTLSPVS